jgi:hydrogenase-4 component B
MWSLLGGCAIMVAGAVAALIAGRSRLGAGLAVGSVWAGCLAALLPVVATLAGRAPDALSLSWHIPWGAFEIGLDGLAAFFALPLLILAPLCALYGLAYLNPGAKHSWFFFNLLVVSMLLVVAARNGILFLMAWELMALSSFLLVVSEDRMAAVRKAGWIYLVATHLGTAALLVFFALLSGPAGDFAFDGFALSGGIASAPATTLFLLALAGFGAKAGIFPLHVWLPEAHPAAPSHVSALMSAVMIKTGIYGLLRAITFLGTVPPAWGWTLVLIGLISGIFGAAQALAQNDLKRLLAYSSVENVGIIFLGLGAGLLGLSWQMPLLAGLGLGGALLHVLNHALFKGLLFLGAGSVLHATGTRQIDQLGGLIKRMPWTAGAFLTGAAAISALPPLNGFISEFMIYYAGVQGALAGTTAAIGLAAALLGGLALIGGLAVAGFTKCAGLAFLGEARSHQAAGAHEAPGAMRGPLLLLAALCLVAGLSGPWLLVLVAPAVQVLTADRLGAGPIFPDAAQAIMLRVTLVALLFLSVAALLSWMRQWQNRRRGINAESIGTWDCGFAQPSARMQYTGSSYAQPLTDLLRACLHTRRSGAGVNGHFPAGAGFASRTPDIVRSWFFDPLFRLIARWLSPLLALQHGRIHLYVLYVAVVLIGLLVWKAGV